MKTYNKKNVLAVVAGILTTGLILNTVYEVTLTQIEGIENAKFQKDFEQDVEYIQNTPIQDTILEQAVSISPEDAITQRKIENIRKYLQKRNSPLAEYADEFVYAAQEYGIDYRLVAAISIIESSGGIHNFRPHNAWGWGKMTFSTWEEGIWTVSKGLGKYYARGLTTPQRIGVYYCPPSASSWANKVTFVMNEIEK